MPPLPDGQPVYAVDGSAWARCDAEASPERGYSYHPSRHSAGQPIVAGWHYQGVAQVGCRRERGTAPLAVRRVHPRENANTVAVEQVARAVQSLPGGPVPLFVFDAGSDSAQLQQGVAGQRAALLVRLRSGRCFYGDPPPGPPRPQGGRPWRHGHKLDCADPATWPKPTATLAVEDAPYGVVRVQAWAGVHPTVQAHERRGSRGPTPIVRGTLLRVAVARLPRPTREPQVRWLWWPGPASHPLDLAFVWRAYRRRFDLEHTFRFRKQPRGWQTLRVRHPEQADWWTWLVLVAYTQLRLARALVADRRLPWERRCPPGRLTPCRVRRAVPALLLALGTPARAPHPCGRSPGRPKGRQSEPAPRDPASKQAA